MLAIGGAIGTGLFLGAGGRLHQAGPALALTYAACGLLAFAVLRALGELVLYRPSSGAFVSYAREFMGEKGAYVAGWMYFVNWGTTGIADITAIAQYSHHWSLFVPVPQWVLALIALIVVLSLNLISVRLFGEMEFWFAIVKVGTLVLFMAVSIVLLVTQHPVGGRSPGFGLIADNGGFLPNGALPVVLVAQGIVFAYAGIELVGVAAGETAEPHKVMPRAINSILWRIAVFYVGSIVLLSLLLPFSDYRAGESPFVTVLSAIGIPGAGDVMNLVVLTAAMSSLNSGLYATGRVLRSMSAAGSAPRFLSAMNRGKVPYAGILFTGGFCALGVGVNFFVPDDAFEIVLHISAVAIITTWSMIMLCHLCFLKQVRRGRIARPAYRLPGAPYTHIASFVALAGVLVLMWFDRVAGRTTLYFVPLLIAALVAGWFLVRRRVRELAEPEGDIR
ncbi:amino acid permease [Amycolatopsis japonica]